MSEYKSQSSDDREPISDGRARGKDQAHSNKPANPASSIVNKLNMDTEQAIEFEKKITTEQENQQAEAPCGQHEADFQQGNEAVEPSQSPSAAANSDLPEDQGIETGQSSKLQEFIAQCKSQLFEPKPGVSSARQKTMVLLVPVLLVAFIFILVQVFGGGPGNTQAASATGTKNASADETQQDLSWQKPEPYPEDLRDPMQRVFTGRIKNAEDGQTGDFKILLKGIVHSNDKSTAVISDRLFHEGDTINGVTIREISKDKVILEKDGKSWEQKVYKNLSEQQ